MKKYCQPSLLGICAPHYFLHDTVNSNRFIVMEYLNEDLTDVICQHQQPRDPVIQRLVIGMFDAMQAVHEKTGHIHRDLKPANFRLHKDKVYITDFGLVRPWYATGQHVPFLKNCPLEGTLTFASMWTHEGVSQSRRDDLEMLGYSILQLLGPDPKKDFWPALQPGLSLTELNLYYYQKKVLLLNNDKTPRYEQTINFIR